MSVPPIPALREAVAAHPWEVWPALPGRRNHLPAGVLVPLLVGGDVRCVLTERSSAMREHAGEVSFPGGRPEARDGGDLARTALREAREEVGIVEAEVLGRLSSVPVYTSDYRLEPFVAVVRSGEPHPASGEVSRVLPVSVGALLAAPSVHAIPWEDSRRVTHLSPVFEVEDRVVFGATAFVLLELLRVVAPVFGRPVPPLVSGRYTWQDVLPPAFAPQAGGG